jgi:hypothetical protein
MPGYVWRCGSKRLTFCSLRCGSGSFSVTARTVTNEPRALYAATEMMVFE